MGFVHPRIRIESLVFHDAVDQVVNHRSDVVHAAQAIIQRRPRRGLRIILLRHLRSS